MANHLQTGHFPPCSIAMFNHVIYSLAQTPTRGKPLSTESEGGHLAMELKSCLDYHRGGSFNMVVDWHETIGDHHFGVEVPFQVKVAFRHEGAIERTRMSLYNVRWAGQRMGEAWEAH